MTLTECFQYLMDCTGDVGGENADPEVRECCQKIKVMLECFDDHKTWAWMEAARWGRESNEAGDVNDLAEAAGDVITVGVKALVSSQEYPDCWEIHMNKRAWVELKNALAAVKEKR